MHTYLGGAFGSIWRQRVVPVFCVFSAMYGSRAAAICRGEMPNLAKTVHTDPHLQRNHSRNSPVLLADRPQGGSIFQWVAIVLHRKITAVHRNVIFWIALLRLIKVWSLNGNLWVHFLND